MTIMGMAASQARFLGLTSRKSNVEYQGQQINQQRTALANQSSTLYNHMLQLSVPTPPSTTEYYTTTYTLDNSGNSINGDYTIYGTPVKSADGSNKYSFQLVQQVAQNAINSNQTNVNTARYDADNGLVKISLGNSTTELSCAGSYDGNSYALAPQSPYAVNDAGESTTNLDKFSTYTVYQVNQADNYEKPTGYETYMKENGSIPEGDSVCFYVDASGNNQFFLLSQLQTAVDNRGESGLFTTQYQYSYSSEGSIVEATGYLQTSSSGRFSSVTIESASDSNLVGNTYSISVSQTKDDDAYQDAFNEYQYQKALYDQAVSEINAQTEEIQAQDKQLELRLDQLDTEQKAISTELDSVKNVIQKNVEATFKIFA